jgi:PKD repeat protein
MGRLLRFNSHVLMLAALLLVILTLASCGGGGTAPRVGAQLTALDGDGNALPDSSVRLEPTTDGYSIYALDGAASGFELRYDASLRVMQVHRGEYFNSDDLFLAISPGAGGVDIGGYRLNPEELPAGGLLVARVALMDGGELQRVRSALPTDAGCIARGFGYSDNGDGSATFHWSFYSAGDYSQDGEVNISDITPIGVSYGKRSTDSGWAAAALADGDSNGEVNISDLTPIGVNYGTQVSGYKLERAATEAGSYSERASVAVGDGIKSPELKFSYHESAAVDGDWYRVRAFAASNPAQGATTDPLHVSIQTGGGGGNPPVADFTFAPQSPIAGDTVLFIDASTGAPTNWAWDFGDSGSSPFQSPAHTFTSPGTFTVQLTATNADGSSQASYQVTVAALPMPDNPADTFVQEASATLNGAGTAFTIHSTDQPDGTSIIFGPLTQGEQPVDNNLNLTFPYRGGLDEPGW